MDSNRSKALLRCGMLAGPFYLAVGLLQARLREGFDVTRHPLSVLALGPGGWIQTANFVITGLMVIAAAVGFGRALAWKPRALTWFLAGFGLCMIVAAIFPSDPMDGFPPGTPEGPPTSISTTGLVHFASGALGFACLAISCFIAARTMWRRHAPSFAWLSLLSGLAVVLGFFGGMAFPWGIWGIWFAVVEGWAWLALMSVRLSSSIRG